MLKKEGVFVIFCGLLECMNIMPIIWHSYFTTLGFSLWTLRLIDEKVELEEQTRSKRSSRSPLFTDFTDSSQKNKNT